MMHYTTRKNYITCKLCKDEIIPGAPIAPNNSDTHLRCHLKRRIKDMRERIESYEKYVVVAEEIEEVARRNQ